MKHQELEILINQLRALPNETEWVEFKQNKCIPQLIGEYLSALSNSACLANKEHGYLVFGIEDETHQIIGTDCNPAKVKQGNQELENWLATLLSPRIDFKIKRGVINDKTVVLFEIDATLNQPVKFKGTSYIRVGSTKKLLKEHPEKERKIWQNVRRNVFEKEYAIRNINSEKVLELIEYPEVFKKLNFPLPTNKQAILDKLEKEKFIVEKLNRYHITNLGALLFAYNLNTFEKLQRKIPRVIIYKGNNRTQTIKEIEFTSGYGITFEKIVDYVNDQLPVNEEIERALRKEVRLYPALAVRELIANAFIHQDLNVIGSSPMIEIFDNRIEFTNPGKPLIATNRFIDHTPESRNEMLASAMRRMNYCEERGSGIDKVILEIETFQLPAPEFIAGDNFTRVILYSPKSLRQMSKPDKVRACYQHCCLKYVSGDYMNNQSFRERLNIEKKNYPTVSRIIKDCVGEGLVIQYENSRMYVPFWAG